MHSSKCSCCNCVIKLLKNLRWCTSDKTEIFCFALEEVLIQRNLVLVEATIHGVKGHCIQIWGSRRAAMRSGVKMYVMPVESSLTNFHQVYHNWRYIWSFTWNQKFQKTKLVDLCFMYSHINHINMFRNKGAKSRNYAGRILHTVESFLRVS